MLACASTVAVNRQVVGLNTLANKIIGKGGMSTQITVLGAGFGGMELSTILSESLGDKVQVTLIDKSDAFIFGFSKLDVMFGRTTLDAVRLPYRNFVKPGVRLLRETVTAIDATTRRVTTDAGTHDCDYRSSL